MKKIAVYSTGFMLTTLLTMCTSNNIYINREMDNAEGQVMLNRLYGEVGERDFDMVEGMVSDSMKLIGGGKSGINQLLNSLTAKLVTIKATTLKIVT